jgi:hypothetical protein
MKKSAPEERKMNDEKPADGCTIFHDGRRTTLRLTVANLTSEQAWALLRLRDLFTDPDKLPLLARWLDGRSFLHYDPDVGLIRHVPAVTASMISEN